jgi:hypothetical protein
VSCIPPGAELLFISGLLIDIWRRADDSQ